MQRNEFIGVILATGALLFLSYWPILQNFQAAPPDRYYYGQQEYPIDMLGDLSYVQQGYQGHLFPWLNYSTLIGGRPSILKMEYAVVGLLGRFVGVSPSTMFFVSRFVISLLVLLTIYFLIHRIFAESWQRIVSYVFVLFGAGITLPGVPNAFVTGGVYDMQVFTRLTQAMHHYLLGAGAVLLALYFLTRTLENPKRTGMFLLSIIFGIAASLLYAPNVVLLISGFPLYIIFDSIQAYLRTKRVRIDAIKIGIVFAFSAITIGPALYVNYTMTYVFNDVRADHMEQLNPFRIMPAEYVFAVGISYLFALISIPWVLRKGKSLMLLLATWVVMHPIGEFIISPILHVNYVRYFLTPYFVAFGILSTVGVTTLSRWVSARAKGLSQRVVTVVLIITFLFTSVGTYVAVWNGEHLCFCFGQYFDFGYPKKTVMDGVFWLHANTKPDDIVLSSYYTGMLIAAFAGNRVYVSWWYRLVEPPMFNSTQATLTAFYSGTMTDVYAEAFLKQEHIAYVFYADQERNFEKEKSKLPYSFLRERYNRDGTIIYEVQ